MADDSSAQTSAPNNVTMPPTAQTDNTPTALGTCRLISEGCTKMDAPMIIPTTIAVAWTRPMGLSSEAEGSGLAKRGVYHKAWRSAQAGERAYITDCAHLRAAVKRAFQLGRSAHNAASQIPQSPYTSADFGAFPRKRASVMRK